MKKKLFLVVFAFLSQWLLAQTKVSGIVVDNTNQPVPYANVVFKNSSLGTVTNEDGRFYIESDQTYKTLVVSFMGFETKEVPLTKDVNYNFKVTLSDGNKLKEVVVYSGKTSKKNNPALDILRKIWEKGLPP